MSQEEQTVRVLHFSSHDEDCGVGKYQEQYLVGMADLPGVHNKFFEISPYQTRVMNSAELQKVLDQLSKELQDYDILHIQHEFGLYHFDQFKRIAETAKDAGKKLIVTVHLSPGFAIQPPQRKGVGPRGLIKYALDMRNYKRMIDWHVTPMRMADKLIIHNEVTRQSLEKFGVAPERIQKIPHPVYTIPTPPNSTEIATHLNKKEGDVVYCITGFLHRYKGVMEAVRALKFLPDNYKLALLGGVKADSDEVSFQDKVTDLIDQLGLQNRVYITGFVQDDDRLNALIQECDVSVYPYDRVYYSSLSSGSLNLAFANKKPVIAYPTAPLKELAETTDALILTGTFAYYELARELQRIDIPKQIAASEAYSKMMAWPKMAEKLVELYRSVVA